MKAEKIYTTLFICLLIFASACSQQNNSPSYHQHNFKLGANTVSLKETAYASGPPMQIIQLHSNETTADEVAKAVSAQYGIDYLQIVNDEKRLIRFAMQDARFLFDPNRMFSTDGIKASLQLHSRFSAEAFGTVSGFRNAVSQLLQTTKTIVAVHNNGNGQFSLAHYISNKTGLVYANSAQDIDDFFITTDSLLFEKIKAKKWNVVWEDKDKIKDDGSLSRYCSRQNIRYVNVEAEHGHRKEQEEMLTALVEILR